jgi:hypothetical protein
METSPLDSFPAVKGKKQITSLELLEFLKDKRITLSCGHHFTIHNFSNTMIVFNDGQTECHS